VAPHTTAEVLVRADHFWAVEAVVDVPKRKRQPNKLDPLAGVETNRPFPRLRLTDAQWDKISKLSGIPNEKDEARKLIEVRLGMFRQIQDDDLNRRSVAEIKKDLRALGNDTKSLYKQLFSVMSNRAAYAALTHEGTRGVSKLCDLLLHAPKWFLIASQRIKNEKRGPKSTNVHWLVGNLDGIREQFAGTKVSRSKKDRSLEYVIYVCKIADPAVGEGSILNAVRDRTKRRRRSVVVEF
jgi:hypothetical protein